VPFDPQTVDAILATVLVDKEVWFFSSLSHTDSSFVAASDVIRLERYSANVLFGAPDQGQRLDV
jgi:hypothetical protein